MLIKYTAMALREHLSVVESMRTITDLAMEHHRGIRMHQRGRTPKKTSVG